MAKENLEIFMAVFQKPGFREIKLRSWRMWRKKGFPILRREFLESGREEVRKTTPLFPKAYETHTPPSTNYLGDIWTVEWSIKR